MVGRGEAVHDKLARSNRHMHPGKKKSAVQENRYTVRHRGTKCRECKGKGLIFTARLPAQLQICCGWRAHRNQNPYCRVALVTQQQTSAENTSYARPATPVQQQHPRSPGQVRFGLLCAGHVPARRRKSAMLATNMLCCRHADAAFPLFCPTAVLPGGSM